jgi:hypothetical protein
VKDSFCEELESVLNKFPEYHTKVLSGDFNERVNREYILIQQLGIIFYLKLVMILQLEK